MNGFARLVGVGLVWSAVAVGQTAAPVTEQTAPQAAPAVAPQADAVVAVPFGPGAKVFVEPMEGFGAVLTESLVKRKVPVVVVKDAEQADFIVTGEAHVRRRGFVTGMVLSDRGGGHISIQGVRAPGQVFTCAFNRVDQALAEEYVYQGWANGCARRLKKTLERK